MELIGTGEAAGILEVNWKTAKRWALVGDTDGIKLPVVAKRGGAFLFNPDDVRAFRDRRIAAERARLEERASAAAS